MPFEHLKIPLQKKKKKSIPPLNNLYYSILSVDLPTARLPGKLAPLLYFLRNFIKKKGQAAFGETKLMFCTSFLKK